MTSAIGEGGGVKDLQRPFIVWKNVQTKEGPKKNTKKADVIHGWPHTDTFYNSNRHQHDKKYQTCGSNKINK